MGTSRSIDPDSSWHAGAYLFSGLSDPVWPLTHGHARQLVEIWDALVSTDWAGSIPDVLGFRGAFISDGIGRVWATKGSVVILSDDGETHQRSDPERRLEREILATAPPGFLPDDLE